MGMSLHRLRLRAVYRLRYVVELHICLSLAQGRKSHCYVTVSQCLLIEIAIQHTSESDM